MIYVTGDCHGNFGKLFNFCITHKTSVSDILVILGDAGINFYNDIRDYFKRRDLATLPLTVLCIHGNHEMRPTHMDDFDPYTLQKLDKKMYHLVPWNEGKVYKSSWLPNVLFARDGDIYHLDGKSILVCGGAYSPDKPLRLKKGWPWFADEQPSTRTKHKVEKAIAAVGGKVDIVMTHTIPMKYVKELHLDPIEGIDQSTEIWLDSIEDSLNYTLWYAGHFHVDKQMGKLRILMDDIVPLGDV